MTMTQSWKIFGFIWAPGVGKTVAMNIVEHPDNIRELSSVLGRDPQINVVRKSTTRPNRWADDRLKISGVPEEHFDAEKDNYIGEYVLTNNGARYAYHVDELQKEWDILIAEPSIHHLWVIKDYLKDNLVLILLAWDSNYRETRMNGRWTEEISQIRKRLVEWDVQIFIASQFSWDNWKNLEKLIDTEWYAVYEKAFSSTEENEAEVFEEMKEYFTNYIWWDDIETFAHEAAKEYMKLLKKSADHKGQKLFDHIVVKSLEDEMKVTGDFLKEGIFRDTIVNIVKSYLG